MSTKKITGIAMISVFAYLSILIIKIPIQFLSYEIKDIIIIIGGFILGIVPAIIICIIVVTIEMITISNTGIIGFLMNFIASVLYIVPICICYKNKKVLKGIIIGTVFMTVGMFLFNIIITPIYLGIPFKETVVLLFTLITPFNIGKGIINGIILLIVYKPLIKALNKSQIQTN